MATETPLVSSFLGLVKRGTCPCCGAPIAPGLGASSMILCTRCGDYLEIAGKNLRQMDTHASTQRPAFAAPTPWADMQAARHGGALALSAANALTDMILTKKEGVRVLEAQWPAGCCVCGKPATREQRIAERFVFTPPGLIRVTDKEVTVVAQGIPLCAEHQDGAAFGPVLLPGASMPLGIMFRSYAYQIQFRKLNPWKWQA